MTSSDRLDMQFFGKLSKEISSDKEVMDALKEERDLQGIFNVLKSYGYLQDMDFPAYVSKVLGAVDALKYYLDPDTGDFSTDAICTDEDRNLQFSFDLLHDLILHLLGRDTIQARFPLIVETENGKVRGGLKRLHNIVEWFDIAYGDRAVQGKRWHKAQPPEPIERVQNCTAVGEANLQKVGSKMMGIEGKLTLNIFRPNTDKRDLPVLVYFHGGNFQAGRSEEVLGHKLCETLNIVFVGIETRLNIFAYNPLPALHTGDPEEDSGNFGLLDYKAGLEWVQRNIANFGGDPGCVTISGFSAGGRSVMISMLSPIFKGLFHRAVAFSSGLTVCDYEKSLHFFVKKLANLVVQDGIKPDTDAAEAWLLSENNDDKAMVRYWLRSQEGKRLINLFPLASARMDQFPHFFADGYVIPKNGFDAELANDVPLLAFASMDEFSAFVNVDPYFKKRTKENPDDENLRLEKKLARKYGSIIWAYFNAQMVAEKLYPKMKSPIFLGKFQYGHEEKYFSEDYHSKYGAVHGIYLSFLSDQYKTAWKRGNDFFEHDGAEYLGSIFLNCLKAFMVNGDPNCEYVKQRWDRWSPEVQTTMVFDGDREKGRTFSETNIFSYDKLFREFDSDESVSQWAKEYIKTSVLNGRFFSGKWDEHYHLV